MTTRICRRAGAALALALGLHVAWAEDAAPKRAEALLMLDYQVVPVPSGPSIDLMGFHLLHRWSDSFYLGVGGYAPLAKGDYGGFMAFDVTAHVQRPVYGRLFVDAGVSAGGGGGGKSAQQSKVLSGTGGFAKTYLGLGHAFDDFSVGANVSRMVFVNSAIHHTQLNLFLQVPFSYAIGPYARAGEGIAAPAATASPGAARTDENMFSIGADHLSQQRPEGSNKGSITLADLQYAHFMTKDSYWFFDVGVGVRGLPLYNQVLGGLGVRLPVSSRVNLYGQLGVGSGGYAPDTINTGAGLLVYPKLSAELMLDRHLGLAVSAGYLWAPNGSSKNATLGAALNYHIDPAGGEAAASRSYRPFRLHLFHQSEFDVQFKGLDRSSLRLLTLQGDSIVDPNIYLPLQVAVATNAYLGYPGYGELLGGIGVQTAQRADSRVQLFGQLLAGANVHGPVLKYGVGLNLGLGDRLAAYGLAGQTFGVDKDRFRAAYLGLGLSYRFSVPGW